MRAWLLLTVAIAAEVFGTLSLRAAVDNPWWGVAVAAAYVTAYALIGLVLRSGMPLGTVYGIWGAVGVALVAIFGAFVFGEPLNGVMLLGILVIGAGVLLLESGADTK